MAQVKVPTVGESITEVTIANWLKKDGDIVKMDEVIAELESDKATFELPAPDYGTRLQYEGLFYWKSLISLHPTHDNDKSNLPLPALPPAHLPNLVRYIVRGAWINEFDSFEQVLQFLRVALETVPTMTTDSLHWIQTESGPN